MYSSTPFLQQPLQLLPFQTFSNDALSIAADLGFSVAPPPSQGPFVYDKRDRCVFELRKTFLLGGGGGPMDGVVAELRALIEGVHAAVAFGLKRVDICCDNKSVYQYLTGKDRPANKMTVTLVDALILIQRKIGYRVHGTLYTKQKSASKLAKAAIPSQQCTICLEHIYIRDMFSVNRCLHRFCNACIAEHAKSKLHQGQLPECPHENCGSKLDIKSCKKFLDKNLYNIMSSRIKEASIPPNDRLYCPFPKCSALMSKTELQNAASTSSQELGKRTCSTCHRIFCMNCKVPWHYKFKCSEYVTYSANQFADEVKLKSLATSNRWRQCVKCMHMIELATGCYHVTCRCGYEFCYRCGAEFIKKKPGCSCPYFELGYILYDT